MPEPTLQELASRLDEMERKLSALMATVAPARDWRSVVGISDENEFTRAMRAEIEAHSEAERQAALREDAR